MPPNPCFLARPFQARTSHKPAFLFVFSCNVDVTVATAWGSLGKFMLSAQHWAWRTQTLSEWWLRFFKAQSKAFRPQDHPKPFSVLITR